MKLFNELIEISPNGQPMQPDILLASKNGDKHGIIQNAVSVVYAPNFNSADSLSFNVTKVIDGRVEPLWEYIKDFKLVYVDHLDEWFEITININESDTIEKHITGTQVQNAELSQLTLNEIEINTEDDIARDDYVPTVFYNPDNVNGSLLHRLLKDKASHYTIYHVDDTLKNLQREFTFDSTNINDALNKTIAEELECVFIFGEHEDKNDTSIHRTISAYDLKDYCPVCAASSDYAIRIKARGDFTNGICPTCGNTNIKKGYGIDTSIFLSTDNFTSSITYNTNAGSVKNCFRLEAGDDDMTAAVKAINPNGTSYIWYLSDELRKDMSPELANKLDEYDQLYSSYNTSEQFAIPEENLGAYNALIEKYQQYDEKLTPIQSPCAGYANLTQAEYEASDFYGYLTNSLLPVADARENQTIDEAIALLTSENLSPLGVNNASTVSQYTVTSAIKDYAKVYVDGALFKIEPTCVLFDDKTWVGTIKLTQYTDTDNTRTTDTLNITVNDDVQNFVKQKAEKLLSYYDSENIGVVALFKLTNDEFAEKLHEYSLSRLNTFYQACEDCLSVLMDVGFGEPISTGYYLYSNYFSKFGLIESEVALREKEIQVILNDDDETGLLNIIFNIKSTISNSLNLQTFLGTDLWTEFSAFRRDGEYSNSNFISDGLNNAEIIKNAQDFYQKATTEIIKSATLQHSISAKLFDFLVLGIDTVDSNESDLGLQIQDGEYVITDKNDVIQINASNTIDLISHFDLGNWIRIEVDEKVYRLRLVSYSINYEDLKNLTITFSDVVSANDTMSDIASILSSAKSMASTYSYVSRKADKGYQSSEYVNSAINDGFHIGDSSIVNNDNQSLVINSSGMLLRKRIDFSDEYDAAQAKIINNGIYFTDDSWETVQTALGKFNYYDPDSGELIDAYGLIANTVVGNLLLGENLGIYTENGSLKMNENGLTITTNEGNTAFTIQRDNEDGTVTKLMYVDDDGNLVLTGDMIQVDEQSMTSWIQDMAVPFTLELTNDNFTIKDEDYSFATTTLSCHLGKYDVSSDVTYTFSGSYGIIDNWNPETKVYKITNMLTDSGSIAVTAQLDEDRIQTKIITVNKISDGDSTIVVTIDSSNGSIFRNNGINTILTCTVYDGMTDITDTISEFYWYKCDMNGNVDEDWTKTTNNNYLIISQYDVESKATFYCEIDI